MRRILTGLLVVLVASLLAPEHLRAQAPSQRARTGVEAGLRLSTLLDGTELMWGGAALLRLHPRISVGGAGWLLTRKSTIQVPSPGSDLDLAFGYGGIVSDLSLMDTEAMAVAVRVLVGAGNAKVIVPVVGSEIGADNFGVLEPEISLEWRLLPPFALRISAAYLYAFGVEDLPQIVQDDFRGYSAGLSLSVALP